MIHKAAFGDQKQLNKYMPKRIAVGNLFLIGFGRIAQLVAKKVKDLGIKIIVYAPYIKEEYVFARSKKPGGMKDL